MGSPKREADRDSDEGPNGCPKKAKPNKINNIVNPFQKR
jgi:hypothetical protein